MVYNKGRGFHQPNRKRIKSFHYVLSKPREADNSDKAGTKTKVMENSDLKDLPVGVSKILKNKFFGSQLTPDETYDQLWKKYSKVYPKYTLQKLLTDLKIMKKMKSRGSKSSDTKKTVENYDDIYKVRILYAPWDAIEFGNGYVRIYNFDDKIVKRNRVPFVVKNKIARSSFNKIIPYFKKRLDPVRVKVRNNEIVALDRTLELERAIAILNNNDIDGDWDYKGRLLVLTRDSLGEALNNSQEQILQALRRKKSGFLMKLMNNQAANRKIVPCIETLEHSESSAEEEAFIFIINTAWNKIKIVFENENPARSTIVFETGISSFNKALQTVFDFMRSNVLNKRLNLMYRKFDFRRGGITDYYSVKHDDKYEWIKRIKA